MERSPLTVIPIGFTGPGKTCYNITAVKPKPVDTCLGCGAPVNPNAENCNHCTRYYIHTFNKKKPQPNVDIFGSGGELFKGVSAEIEAIETAPPKPLTRKEKFNYFLLAISNVILLQPLVNRLFK